MKDIRSQRVRKLTPLVFLFSFGITSSSSVALRNPGMTTLFLPLTSSVASPSARPEVLLFLTGDVLGSTTALREAMGDKESRLDVGGGPVHHAGSGVARRSSEAEMVVYGFIVRHMGRSSAGCLEAFTTAESFT
jgi:hypothetical protein